MHHKRGKPKNARAGCLMCKPHKANGARGLKRTQVQKTGFSNIRGLANQSKDYKDETGTSICSSLSG